jgi:hypothetical protein
MYVHMSSIFSVNTEVYFRGIKFIVLTFKYWLEFSVYIWCFDRLIDWKKKSSVSVECEVFNKS